MPALTALVLATLVALGQPPHRPTVLILSGRNNHDWRSTTPALKRALEVGGRFDVSVTERPEECTRATLSRFDVIVSNWNTYGEAAPADWPQSARDAFVSFVRSGKGHVTVHAGGSSFPGWLDYRSITGTHWAEGVTGHGAVHRFVVRVTDPSHPITHGINTLLTVDELWHRTGVLPGLVPLATAFSDASTGGSGADEPVVWAGRFGDGRTVALALGHDAAAISTSAFGVLLRRSTQWAATGKVTGPATHAAPSTEEWVFLLDAARKYKPGDRRDALLMLEDAVGRVAGTAEAQRVVPRVLALVQDASVSPEARQFVCRRLGLIGDERIAPALVKLIGDQAVGTEARFALERIPGPRASGLLRAALRGSSGRVRLSLLNAVGVRRDAVAVPIVAAIARGNDSETRAAAITTLGEIGTPAALAALQKIASAVPASTRPAWWRAQLSCADRMARSGSLQEARSTYAGLVRSSAPAALRVAAISGSLDVAGPARDALFVKYLRSADGVERAAAANAASFSAWAVPAGAYRAMRMLRPEQQASLLLVATQRGDTRAIPAAAAFAQASNVTLRKAALSTLGALGSSSHLPLVVPSVGAAYPAVAAAAVDALERLKGADVSRKLAAIAASSNGPTAAGLYRVLAARARTSDSPWLVDLCERRPASRGALLPVVRELGGTDACGPLLRMLAGAGEDERDTVRDALVAICSRARTNAEALRAFASSSGAVRAALCSVVGAVENDAALTALTQALADPDTAVVQAAIGALGSWNRATPIAALADLILRTGSARLRTLAVRSLTRLAGLAVPDERGDVSGHLERCATFASPADRKTIAATLGVVPCLAALQLAERWTSEQDVASEAAISALRIADALAYTHETDAARIATTLETHAEANIRSLATGVRRKLARGENLALGARAVSTDGLSPDGAGSGPAAAVDGDLATYWDEQDDQPRYAARFELLRPRTVALLRIVGHQHHLYAPRDFDVVIDGKVVAQVRDAQYTDNVLNVALPETSCSTLELVITRAHGRSPAIRELELYSRLPRSLP